MAASAAAPVPMVMAGAPEADDSRHACGTGPHP